MKWCVVEIGPVDCQTRGRTDVPVIKSVCGKTLMYHDATDPHRVLILRVLSLSGKLSFANREAEKVAICR